MSNPIVSIIMPVYNASKFLSESIESIINQDFEDWELIIIDDCSTDCSAEIAEQFSLHDARIRLYRNQVNLGAAATRSAGVPLIRGLYVSFLDADDLWMPNKLTEQLSYMSKERVAMCFTSYETIESDGTIRNIVHVPPYLDYEGFLKNTVTCSHTVMFNLSMVPKESLIAPTVEIDFSEDLAVWLQVLKSGIAAHGLDLILAKYRKHPSSRSANKLRSVRRTWTTYRQIENLGFAKSAKCLVFQLSNALRKRIRS